MKVWERNQNGVFYEVDEVSFDGDLHEFMVVKEGGSVLATIRPLDMEDMQATINDLDNGLGVDGWDDGTGGRIVIK